jgi:ATP-dependent RNA helicase HelY
LAALASGFVYEPRTDERLVPVWPTVALAERWAELERLWEELVVRERKVRLPPTRQPDPGFVTLAYEWAEGGELHDLPSLRLQPGDFVRVSRQLVDLLKQVRDVSPELASQARGALAAVDRGVVAAMGVG